MTEEAPKQGPKNGLVSAEAELRPASLAHYSA